MIQDYNHIVILAIAAFGCVVTSVLTGYSLFLLDSRQQLAYKGDMVAAKKLILPCYRPLYIGLIVYFIIIAIAVLLTLLYGTIPTSLLYFILQGYSLCLLTSFMICPLLFVQHSISIRSFMIITLILLPWLIISAACLILTYVINFTDRIIPKFVFLFITFVPTFIFIVLVLSRGIPSRIRLASRSNRNTVEHVLIYITINALLNILSIIDPPNDTLVSALLLAYVSLSCVWNILFSLSLHRSLLADTKYWRGLGTHNKDGILTTSTDNLPRPNLDFSVASTVFQEMMTNIGNLTIDFAYLEAKEKIGMGSTAIVYKGKYKHLPVAIKMYTPNDITSEVLDEFVKEARLSSSFEYKNIVKFYGLCIRPPQIAFVIEYCGEGSLKSSLERNMTKWKPLRRLRACRDACRAVAYLHKQNYIHRDIKTENFFVMSDFVTKLGDFGETIPAVSKSTWDGVRLPIVGTVAYMAPELIAATPYYTNAIDIYALGITFWEIWTGLDSYKDMSSFQIYDYVGNGNRPDISDVNAPNELLAIMTSAWDQNPEKRPSAEILVKRFDDLIKMERDLMTTLENALGVPRDSTWRSNSITSPRDTARSSRKFGLSITSIFTHGLSRGRSTISMNDTTHVSPTQPRSVTTRGTNYIYELESKTPTNGISGVTLVEVRKSLEDGLDEEDSQIDTTPTPQKTYNTQSVPFTSAQHQQSQQQSSYVDGTPSPSHQDRGVGGYSSSFSSAPSYSSSVPPDKIEYAVDDDSSMQEESKV